VDGWLKLTNRGLHAVRLLDPLAICTAHTALQRHRTGQEKIDQADSHQIAVPESFDVSQCVFVRERTVWRIIDDRATLIVDEIWHGPNGENPLIPGVPPRSEFGTEI